MPVAKTTINALQLTQIENIEEDSSNLLQLIISEESLKFNFDSLLKIQDTTIIYKADSISLINWPFPPGSIIPLLSNKEYYLFPNNINLKEIELNLGSIEIEIKSSLSKETTLNFYVPSASLNSSILNTTKIIPAGSISNPSLEFINLDLANYKFDLTKNNSQYNTILISAFATVSEDFDTLYTNINDYIDIKLNFKNIIPKYALGGFANYQFSGEEFLPIKSFLNNNLNGQLYFEKYNIDCTLKNFLGIDSRAQFNSIMSFSSNNIQTNLSSNLLYDEINITRATFNPSLNTISPTSYNFNFNNNNSNVNELFEYIPDSIGFNYKININPESNHSLDNDFIYTEKGIELDLNVSVPFNIGLNNFSFTDTVEFNLNDSNIIKNTQSIIFNLICDNGFPFDFKPVIYLLDSNYIPLDSLFYKSNTINKGLIDENNKISSEKRTIITTDGTNTLNQLPEIKYALFKIFANSDNYPISYPIYSYYKIDLKLTSEFEQKIVTN